jgi:hypothetical protein
VIRWIAAAVLAAALVVGGWFGWRSWHDGAPPARAVIEQAVPEGAPGDVETVGTEAAPIVAGATPMAQRVAVLGLLNKRNGESRELTLRPGQAIRIGDVVVRLRACDRTAPWEVEQLTGAFVQLIVRGPDRAWRRAFSGWLFKERPALNVVPHPVYDVWTKSCATSFPATGADTETLSAPRSSAAKSPARSSDDADDADDTDNAAPSNAI